MKYSLKGMRAFYIGLLVLLFFISFLGIKRYLFALEPGTANDPVVTKSYVENLFGWKVYTLRMGEFAAFEVGTEVVVRSGKAIVVRGSGGGLADLTNGADLPGGAGVPINHLMLSPASDGRGIRAENTVTLMARGWLP